MGEERLAKGCYFKSRWNRVRKNILVGRSMHRCRYIHISRWSRGLIVWERKGGQRSRYFFFCILGKSLPWSKTNSIVSKGKQEQKKKKTWEDVWRHSAHTEMSAGRSKSVPSAQGGTGACIPQAVILCLQTLSGHHLGFEGEILSAGLWESRRRHMLSLYTSKTVRELNWKTLHSPARRQQNRRLNTTV